MLSSNARRGLAPRHSVRETKALGHHLVIAILSLLLGIGTLGVAPEKASAAPIVTTPLPAGVTADWPLAAFGSSVALSSGWSPNLGTTWSPNLHPNPNWAYVGEGSMVDIGWVGSQATVYSVTSGTVTGTYPVSAALGGIASVNTTTALSVNGAVYTATTLASGATAPVIAPDASTLSSAPEPHLTPGGGLLWIGYVTNTGDMVAARAATTTAAPGPWVVVGPANNVGSEIVTATQLRYAKWGAAGVQACYRNVGSLSTESCATVVTGAYTFGYVAQYGFGASSIIQLYDAAGLLADAYLWTGSTAVKIQLPSGTLVDMPSSASRVYGDTPTVLVRDANTVPSLHQVNANGTLGTTIPLPPQAFNVPSELAIAPDRVVGGDNRDASDMYAPLTWTRSVNAGGFGAESMFAKRASWLGASAGRGLHLSSDGVTVYDRGVMQRVLPADPSSAYLALSGPYWAQYALDPTTLSWTTTAFDVTGTQKATSSQESLLFGSRFVTITTDTDPVAGSIHLTVTDLTGVAAPANFTLPAGTADCSVAGLWGETVALNCAFYTRVDVYNYQTNALLGSLSDTSAAASSVGDGYAVVQTWSSGAGLANVVWDWATNTKAALDQVILNGPVTDGAGHVAYSQPHQLVWRDFSSVASSPPRVLGSLAPATFDLRTTSSMAIDIDATKALSAGSLVIKNGSGTTVRTLAVAASPDGSVRLVWDGTSDAGQFVPSGTYSYSLLATGADGSGAIKLIDGTSAATWNVVVTTPTPGAYVSLTPARIMDTRFGVGGLSRPLAPNESVALQVAGQGGVPASIATAVVLNVTVVAPSQAGNITVYPSDVSVPTASNLNFGPGQTVPNLVTVKLGADGKVKVANQSAGTTYLIADVAGYYVAGTPSAPGAFVPVTPSRLLDTRFGPGPVGAVAPQGSVTLKVTGAGGVPASGVGAVVLNVTETGPSQAGNITVYPSDVAVPTASNLNFVPGDTRPNLVTVKVSADGNVSLANQSAGSTHLIADVAGYYLAGAATLPGMFVPVTPTRLLDTRFGPGPVGAVAAQASIALQITGNAPVPASGVGAVVLNVTETGPSQAGNITVYPSDVSVPTASNLNFVKGDTYPNLTITKVGGTDGKVKLANQSAGTTYLLADVAGYFLK
ncbi:MAG TPA: hypothetical protein DEG88_00680 [Propionibacteriaceae bacterium]|nr:hypothetical protein [Micropruina sp.]HBX80201.1 hypothetical protein [Propionibacteriaceae bacterium]HBY21850.1 hypothetical protein [Propionibacteriaceae bacterium]